MAQLVGSDEILLMRNELRRSLRSLLRHTTSLRANSDLDYANNHDETDEKLLLEWAAIDRLPKFERLRSSLFDGDDEVKGKKVVDVTKLLAPERHMFIERLIKHIENDNLQLLQKLGKRTDRVPYPKRMESIAIVQKHSPKCR